MAVNRLRGRADGAAQIGEKIMSTLKQLSHQGRLWAQTFMAALAMLGMGLEGQPAEQDIQLSHEKDFPPV
jgi:hypothetical protein